MLKINMDVIKCEKHNSTTRPMISLNFRKFWKMRNSNELTKKSKFFNFIKRNMRVVWDGEALYEFPVRKLG